MLLLVFCAIASGSGAKAGAAVTLPPAPVGVLFGEWVPVLAMGFHFVNSPLFAVDSVVAIQGSEREVVRIDAPFVLAGMVDLLAFWDRPVPKFIGYAVSHEHSANPRSHRHTDTSVTQLARYVAYPAVTTGRKFYNLRLESLGQSSARARHVQQFEADSGLSQ